MRQARKQPEIKEMNDPIDSIRLNRRGLLGSLAAAALSMSALSAPARAAGEDVLSEGLVLRDPDIPVAGNGSGDITIVEWFDYQCPYCRKLEPELRQGGHEAGKGRVGGKD